MAEDVKVLVETFDLLKEALPAIGRFPHSFRFTLGQRIETRLFDVLELPHEARFGRRRGPRAARLPRSPSGASRARPVDRLRTASYDQFMQPKRLQIRKWYGTHARTVIGLYDTGSEEGLVRASVAKRLGRYKLPSPISIGGIGHGMTESSEVAHFQVKVQGKWCRYVAAVVPDDALDLDVLIGEDFLAKYALVVDSKRNRVVVENRLQFERMTRRRLFVASPRGR